MLFEKTVIEEIHFFPHRYKEGLAEMIAGNK